MALPPIDPGAVINLALSVVGVGIVSYITTRLAARRAIRDELDKQRGSRLLERRLAWSERTLRAITDFVREVVAMNAAEAGGSAQSLRTAQEERVRRFPSGRRRLRSAT